MLIYYNLKPLWNGLTTTFTTYFSLSKNIAYYSIRGKKEGKIKFPCPPTFINYTSLNISWINIKLF